MVKELNRETGWRRIGFALGRLQEEPFNLFLEYPVFFVILTLLLSGFGTTVAPSWALVAPFLLILVQYVSVSRVWYVSGYVEHLADFAATPRGESGKGPSRLYYFDLHSKALRRLGEWLAPGQFDDLVVLALPEADWKREKRPSLVQIIGAIRLTLQEDAASLPLPRDHEPFARYADLLRTHLARGAVNAQVARQFLVARYATAPERCKTLAAEREKPPITEQIRSQIELWKLLVLALLGIVAVVLRLSIPLP